MNRGDLFFIAKALSGLMSSPIQGRIGKAGEAVPLGQARDLDMVQVPGSGDGHRYAQLLHIGLDAVGRDGSLQEASWSCATT